MTAVEKSRQRVQLEKQGTLVYDVPQYDAEFTTEILGLGSGDSRLILNILPEDLSSRAMDAMRKETRWSTMGHRGGDVPRLVSIQGDVSDGSEPLYRHPADEQPQLAALSETSDAIRRVCEVRLGQPLNHGLVQWYRSGRDFISEHADKTLDVARGSVIVNVSLGATRTMVLRSKERGEGCQRIDLPHNSLFVLGPETNRMWKHEIKLDKRDEEHKRDDERIYDGERISLTFRHIATFRRRADDRVYGQGARIKTLAELNVPDAPGPVEDALEMLQAFSAENRESDFDWDAHYGQGFDALNMKILNDHEQASREAEAQTHIHHT